MYCKYWEYENSLNPNSSSQTHQTANSSIEQTRQTKNSLNYELIERGWLGQIR